MSDVNNQKEAPGSTSKPRAASPLLRLTAATHATIIEYLGSGCTLEVAATAAGITSRTLHNWTLRGREASAAVDRGEKVALGDKPFLALVAAALSARAIAEVQALATIKRAALEGTWQAAA